MKSLKDIQELINKQYNENNEALKNIKASINELKEILHTECLVKQLIEELKDNFLPGTYQYTVKVENETINKYGDYLTEELDRNNFKSTYDPKKSILYITRK